jgi:hypothetical protein
MEKHVIGRNRSKFTELAEAVSVNLSPREHIFENCFAGQYRVNAGEILQRLAGVKVQHGDKQEGPRYRGPSCLSRFIPEGQRPTAVLIGLGVTGAWSERA